MPPTRDLRMRSHRLALLAASTAAALLATAPAANASRQIIARDATAVALKVDAKGRALVSFKAQGKAYKVLAWGALNANAAPAGPKAAQQEFRLDYSGGWKTFGRAYWQTMKSVCTRYDGPALRFVVASCKAPDGSYWVLQSWRRSLPNVKPPTTFVQRAYELHLAHFSGALPVLDVGMDWFYNGQPVPGGRWQHVYGQLTYKGRGLYGFGTDRYGAPTDKFGVLVYMDVLNPLPRTGWWRYNSWVTHNPKGATRGDGTPYAGGTFCAGVFKTMFTVLGPWWGERYRYVVSLPGALPTLVVEMPTPGWYDPVADAAANAEQQLMNPPGDNCSDVVDNRV
jgi:hypothetical protein